jgi:hypothetical protein
MIHFHFASQEEALVEAIRRALGPAHTAVPNCG